MQICVRAHDMGVKGIGPIIQGLTKAGADGAQLVCYKSFEDIEKAPAGITENRRRRPMGWIQSSIGPSTRYSNAGVSGGSLSARSGRASWTMTISDRVRIAWIRSGR